MRAEAGQGPQQVCHPAIRNLPCRYVRHKARSESRRHCREQRDGAVRQVRGDEREDAVGTCPVRSIEEPGDQ